MLNRFLSESVKFDRINVSEAAAATDITSDSVDMSGYRGVCFIVTYGTLTATQVTSMRVQTSSDDGVLDAFADLMGTATPVLEDTDSDLLQIVDVYKPNERYLRVVVDRAVADAIVDSILAVMYDPIDEATTQPADVADIELHLSPAEGTA